MRFWTVLLLLGSWAAAAAQTPYTPKFPGDPAHSQAEAVALGYMRTVLSAEHDYKKKHNGYAPTLAALVHSGSFTKRMVKTDRGDYTVHYRHSKDGFALSMVPKQFDADHRAFFTDETGRIRAEADKPATEQSEIVK